MTLKVACLGAGYFAQFHIEAWQRLDGANLVALCDQNLHAATQASPDVPAFDDFVEMMRTQRPDIVDIITPPPTHLEAIQTALNFGPRVVICQKPFATSLEEAINATEAAEAAGVHLVIHENFRFQPWYRTMKAEMAGLGDILQLSFRLRTGDGQGPDAYLDRQPYFQKMERFLVHETAVHWLDTFTYLLGAPSGIYADLRRINPAIKGEDAGLMILDYPSGARAVFDGNRHLDFDTDNPRLTFGEAILEGTKASLALWPDGRVMRRAFGTQGWKPLAPAQEWQGFAGDCVAALQAHVIAGVESGQFENTARDYLEIRRLEDAAYRSAETGQRVPL